jgi:hypothetical protein
LKTPLCKCEAADMLPVGEYNIKVDPQNRHFPHLKKNLQTILTVVDRTFGKGVTSEGSIIS